MELLDIQIGEYFNQVYVQDLIYKEVNTKAMKYNEIVYGIFYVKDPHRIKMAGNKLFIADRSAKETKMFIAPDLDYYNFDVESSKATNRVTLMRRMEQIITLESEDKDDDDKEKISKVYPIVFSDGTETFEHMEKIYHLVRNSITTPMIPNMKLHTILAGQLFIDAEEATKVLQALNGDASVEVDKKVLKRAKYLMSVYENWVTEIYRSLKGNGYIQPLKSWVNSDYKVTPCEIIVEEDVIEPMISEMVRKGILYFTESTEYDNINGFDDYMRYMGNMMTQRIESISKPIHRYNDIRPETSKFFNELLRTPFEAQANAIEACLKALDLKGKVNVLGEMGVGKSLIMGATNWIHAKLKGIALKLLVYCPDHLVKSWNKEIGETAPNVAVHQFTSVNDLIEFEKNGFLDDNQDRVFILAQKDSKVGYDFKPAVHWNKMKQAFTCPCCAKEVTRRVRVTDPLTKESYYEQQPVQFFHFGSMRLSNYKCKSCKTVLWEPVNKQAKYNSKLVYSGEMKGYYPNDIRPIRDYLSYLSIRISESHGKKQETLKEAYEKYEALFEVVAGRKPEGKKRSSRKAPVANFIFKKMRNRFTHLIVDEYHEFQHDSKRGDACGKLINSVKYVQTGTGTGMNGYADSRFRTDYMMSPKKMKAAGFSINDANKYQATFGIVERRFKMVERRGKTAKMALAPRKRPGISPIIFPLFMQDTTVFISIEDLKNEMPPLEYTEYPVEMDPALKKAHKELKEEIMEKTVHDKKIFRQTVQMFYSFLDSPTVKKELKTRKGEVIVETPVIESYQDNKIRALFDIAQSQVIHRNKRMMVYTHYSGDNINAYLYENLIKRGFKVSVLSPVGEYSISCDGTKTKVAKEEREAWAKQEAQKGTHLLITNPELVKTGCNLIEYPVICWYQSGYQVYTNRQADKRGWRLGQTEACEIIYLYYEDSIQEDVARLMATKIVASRSIEGHMDADGLEALCSSRTAEEELSQIFYNGIKDVVKLERFQPVPQAESPVPVGAVADFAVA